MNADSQTEVKSQRSDTTRAARSVPPAVAGGLQPPTDTKRCPRCPSQGRAGLHPLSDFGICRDRKDGLNHYCKECIREKITAHRVELRTYKRAALARMRNQRVSVPRAVATGSATARRADRRIPYGLRAQLRKLSPANRIMLALKTIGPQQYNELARNCRVSRDDLGDALCDVLGREVGSRNGPGPRIYFLKDDTTASGSDRIPDSSEPRSFGVSTIYREGA